MNQTRTNYLLKQYASGMLTPEEQQEMGNLLSQTDREALVQYIADLAQQEVHPSLPITEEKLTETFQKIVSADKTANPAISAARVKTRFRWLSAAAVLLLSFSAFVYFMVNRRKNPEAVSQVKLVKPEKQAGRNTAILTLADNSVVGLDSLNNGLITTQGGSRVMLANGQLAYVPPMNENTAAISYNKITTPRGGEYTITLPDGTKVWLNAASSLKFPTVFSGDKREVELTGEAYLAVAEDKVHPFEVKIGSVNVSVHGTQFNIMGYEDENSIVTTLVSGSVEVSSAGNAAQLLAPGEHAVLKNDASDLYIEKADVDEETAWKNGRTYFNGANIRQIMRQVARWYDVDVQYKGNMVNMDFTCTVSRKDKLSKLLGLLELTGAVHFTMEGNTIIVQP
jgi:ferric-dicitrate binding protein FerR (iron transport regulator)